ncbi:MAG TPA: hypothetical protein VGG39_12700 [Polyangiaceae bacterium]|jgi:hypothetical protein
MSLSSLIVQREVATMRHVEEALARQVIYGGDLVTNLLEVTRIDEGVLTELLAESMRLKPAPSGELPMPADRVRALLPPEMAAQRAVVPLALEDERLVLAVAEPMPAELEEQLAFALGMAIEQRAALAVRVKQAIAKTYGVPLERRMQRLVARLSGESTVSGSMPPPLGMAPSVIEPPRPPSGPPAPRNPTSRSFPAARPLSNDALAVIEAAVVRPEPSPDEVETAPAPVVVARAPDSEPPSTPAVAERRTGLLQREVPHAVRAARRRRGPVTLEAAKAEAEEATDRDALLDLFFEFARQFFDYSAMFLVHGDIAEGRDAFGAGASRERVVGIGVPLDLPGLMTNARDSRAPLVQKAPSDGMEASLLSDLGRPRDAEIAVVPIVVRTRAVALLLADCGEHGLDRPSLQQVVGFANQIGKSFERLIVRRKLDGFIAGSAAGAPKGAGRVQPASVPPKKPSAPPAFAPTPTPTPTLASTPALAPAPGQLPVSSSAPPPTANIASVRPIHGPPIPREEPPDSSPRRRPVSAPPPHRPSTMPPTRPATPFAHAQSVTPPAPAASPAASPRPASVAPIPVITPDGPEADAQAKELFDELGWDQHVEDDDPPPPPSAAISVPAHRPPHRHTDRPSEASVIVHIEDDLLALVDRIVAGDHDEQAEGELLRQGERAMRVLMARFPGPLSIERSRIAVTTPPPRASECGPILRLVVRERKVALPFVLERLVSPDTEQRGWATHLLCELAYSEAIQPLLLRLRDVDLSTRVSAAHALAAIARVYPDEVRGGVLGLAHSIDPIDRAAAMRVMGELREAALVPELVRALGDGDEAVVASAHSSLFLVTRQDFGLDARPWLRWWELNASRHRIEWLIDALTHDIGEVRRSAGEELRAVTKEYFGYAADLPARDRERAQQRYRDWWVTEGRARFRRGH